MRKLLMLSVLAVISIPVLAKKQDCHQSGNKQGQNSACSEPTRMDSGDSILLTSGTVVLACVAGFAMLRRRKLA